MQKKSPPEELNLSEACELLKVSEKTIRKYIKLRKIAATKVGRVWYIDKASLIQFKDNNTVEHQETETDNKPSIPTIPAGAAIHKLACYRLFLTAMHQFDYSKEPEDLVLYSRSFSDDLNTVKDVLRPDDFIYSDPTIRADDLVSNLLEVYLPDGDVFAFSTRKESGVNAVSDTAIAPEGLDSVVGQNLQVLVYGFNSFGVISDPFITSITLAEDQYVVP